MVSTRTGKRTRRPSQSPSRTPTKAATPKSSTVTNRKKKTPQPKGKDSSAKDNTPGSAKKKAEAANKLLVDQTEAERWKKWRVRTISTLLMIGGFLFITWLGHIAMLVFVVLLQLMIFNEILGLRYEKMQRWGLPNFRLITWFFYLACVFYVYGRTLRKYLLNQGETLRVFILQYHAFASFSIYIAAFLLFVVSLKRGLYKYQFKQFAWTHMTLLLVVIQSTVMLAMIMEGLIWFFVPVGLVVCNDVWAFITGFFIGRTPLIKLSPKKTWEGFIGGFIMTIVLGLFVTNILTWFDFMICKKADFAWPYPTCAPGYVFTPQSYDIPEQVLAAIKTVAPSFAQTTIVVKPMLLHTLVFATFASLIAPFGGFFASGFKRAFRIKDFGDSIPGHGGLTDRMDCQIMMAMFTYLYYLTFVQQPDTVADILRAISFLTLPKQRELYRKLGELLGEIPKKKL